MKQPQRPTNRQIGIVTAALVVLLLLGLLAMGLAMGLTMNDRTNAMSAQIATLTQTSLMLKASMVEALMNITALQPVVRTASAGVFTWRRRLYPNPDEYVEGSTYVIETIQLGPLNFTLGIFDPPAMPLDMLAFGGSKRYEFLMESFIPPLPVLSHSYTLELPLTDANKARVVTSSGCLLTESCFIYETIVFHDFVANTPGSSTFILTIQAPPAASSATETFTLSESFQLLFPKL